MDKAQLRRRLRNGLQTMEPAQRKEKSRLACQRLISIESFQEASLIMMYLPLSDEVDTSDAIYKAWDLGKTVVVPRVNWQERTMMPVVINSLDEGSYTYERGLKVPLAQRPMALEKIDLIVTPGRGFDRTGHRVGRGGAFYDRFLAQPQIRAVRCGLAFAEQVVASVPVAWWDELMDLLVTDEQVIRFNSRKGM